MRCILIVLILGFQMGFSQKTSNIDTIKQHLIKITKTKDYRNHKNIGQLNEVANYIKLQFQKHSDSVFFQNFNVEGNTYKNVICAFGTQHKKRIIIGAHYDVCGNQEGADDNASGLVGLLELARLLKGEVLNYRVDLVAYSLEEPPFFRTEHMGSFVHAKHMADEDIDLYGMVSLEMIGYFSNKENSQQYPDDKLKEIYGNKGNFITVVNEFDKQDFAREFGTGFQTHTKVKTVIFDSPPNMPAIDFSDHLNYWRFGFSALMVTDTAFLRNKNYHRKTDTMDTLDITSMAEVINGVFKTLLKL